MDVSFVVKGPLAYFMYGCFCGGSVHFLRDGAALRPLDFEGRKRLQEVAALTRGNRHSKGGRGHTESLVGWVLAASNQTILALGARPHTPALVSRTL